MVEKYLEKYKDKRFNGHSNYSDMAEMNSYTFSAQTNLNERLKNNEMLLAYSGGLVNSSVQYRNALYLRNVGRSDSFVNAKELKEIVPLRSGYSKREWQTLNHKNRRKRRDEKKEFLDEFGEDVFPDRKTEKEYDRKLKEKYPTRKNIKKKDKNAIPDTEEENENKYREFFEKTGIGKAYSQEYTEWDNPENVPLLEVENDDGEIYYSKLLGLRNSQNGYYSVNIDVETERKSKIPEFGDFREEEGKSNIFDKTILDKKISFSKLFAKNENGEYVPTFRPYDLKTVAENTYYQYDEYGTDYEKERVNERSVFSSLSTIAPPLSKNGNAGDGLINDATYSAERLLDTTNKLFAQNKIKTMVNRFNLPEDNERELISSSKDKELGVSKGRNLKKLELKEGESPYIRTWTAYHQYSKYKNAIRHSSINMGKNKEILELNNLRPNNGQERLETFTVLNNVGKVRCAPEGKRGYNGEINLENCMFSIENLAWRDFAPGTLDESQRGPHGGRIMWFPPYNLKFNENVSTQWNSNEFIGRGENIYTYINTERTGTLSFTLLIDHPSILNIWKNTGKLDSTGFDSNNGMDETEENLLRFFAGGEYNLYSSSSDEYEANMDSLIDSIDFENVEPVSFKTVLFFPKYYSGIEDDSDNVISFILRTEANSTDEIKYDKGKFNSEIVKKYSKEWAGSSFNNGSASNGVEKLEKLTLDNSFNCENDNFLSFSSLNSILSGAIKSDSQFFYAINNFEEVEIKVKGCSALYSTKEKMFEEPLDDFLKNALYRNLSNDRAVFLYNYISKKINALNSEIKIVGDKEKNTQHNIVSMGGIKLSPNDSENEELARYAFAEITFFKPKFKNKESRKNKKERIEEIAESVRTRVTPVKGFKNNIKNNDEYSYFEAVNENDSVLTQMIREKVKYFNPAFHSLTPEGFNARLTFLHQCTRQGNTNSASEVSENNNMGAGNLAFGRPPYCILRIGDFYNTKIAIDSMTIDYGEGVPQWDLNPEGIGVQPMMANINLNFKFLGGSDLSGPIEELQNAVSFNFFSNTSVYDKRAKQNIINNKNK